jgi:hypothetical protein
LTDRVTTLTAEVRRKLPVWHALSELFLDTEIQASDYDYIARRLRESGLPAEQIRQILADEVAPAFAPNLRSVAGEWVPWNEESVREIMTRPMWRPTRLLRKWMARRVVAEEWAKLRPLLET